MAQLHEVLVAAVQYGAVPRIQATREETEWTMGKCTKSAVLPSDYTSTT